MREHGTPPYLHQLFEDERPRTSPRAPRREVINEKHANSVIETIITRDDMGRMIRKDSKEIRHRYGSLESGFSWREIISQSPEDFFPKLESFDDISAFLSHPRIDPVSITSEEYEYEEDTSRVLRIVKRQYLDVMPGKPYMTTTIEYIYTPNGNIEEQRIIFQGFNDKTPRTYSSCVTRWEHNKPVEFLIEDGRSPNKPVLSTRRTRAYDELGRILQEEEFEGTGASEHLDNIHRYTYDERDRITRVEREAADTWFNQSWRYEYQDLPEGMQTITRYTFDKDGDSAGGERITIGPRGEKLRHEAWTDIKGKRYMNTKTDWTTENA